MAATARQYPSEVELVYLVGPGGPNDQEVVVYEDAHEMADYLSSTEAVWASFEGDGYAEQVVLEIYRCLEDGTPEQRKWAYDMLVNIALALIFSDDSYVNDQMIDRVEYKRSG